MEKKNNLDPQYNNLLKDILENGVKKQTRNGEVISVFGRQIRHKMSDGFPLLTGKKMFFKGIAVELLWFLRGDTNIKYLVNNNTSIWNGDAYKNFMNRFEWKPNGTKLVPNGNLGELNENGELLSKEEFINKIKTDDEFAKKWGELGPIYGKQWRNLGGYSKTSIIQKEGLYDELRFENKKGIDQIANLINDLKTNPDSRRLMVNAWNVGELDQMVLPPCHYGFQVYTRELSEKERLQILLPDVQEQVDALEAFGLTLLMKKSDEKNIPTRAISLMWNQRSVDTFLGLPFNIASYGLLLEIIAKEVNMIPDELIGNLGDVHLYLNHIEQAKLQTYRSPFALPKLNINTEFWQTESGECGVGSLKTNLMGFEINDFTLENYQSHPTIKAPLSN